MSIECYWEPIDLTLEILQQALDRRALPGAKGSRAALGGLDAAAPRAIP